VSPRAKNAEISVSLLSELGGISHPGKRTTFLRRHKLLQASVVGQLNAATLKEMRVNTDRALALAEAALHVARGLRRDDLTGQSYRAKANVLASAGKYQQAIQLYETALRLFTRLKDNEGIARTLTALIQPCIMVGEYDRAFQAAERAQELLRKLGDERRLARLENNIGNIYHRQDRFEEALVHYQNAYQSLLPYHDSEELTISLNNMSMCLITMNDFARALATYERARELLRGKDLPLIQLINDYNIAYLYYLRGDYRRAIEMLKSSRAAGERIGYRYLVALCYLDLSDIYIELNLSAEAQEVASQGWELFREQQIGYEAAKTLANQAIALGQGGKTQQALQTFAEARELFLREKNEVWPWLIDLYQAIVLFHQGRYFEARRAALGATEFFKGSYLKSKAVLCRMLLSQIALRTGDAASAFQECSVGLELAKDLDSPILRYQLLFLLGQIQQARGLLTEAYASYQQARAEMESLRTSLGRDELKISFMKNKAEIYERLVDLCISGDLPGSSDEEAFSYIELAKSRSLIELLLQRSHPFIDESSGQSGLVHKIRDLREELNWYQRRIEQEQLRPQANTERQISQLHSEAQVKEKQLLAVLAEARDSATASGESWHGQQVPLETVREVLSEHEAVVEYFFLGGRILAAVLTKSSLQIIPLGSIAQASESLRLLRFQLGKLQLPIVSDAGAEHALAATLAHLAKLHRELVAPILPSLRATHLTFVPHGILHYLPFHALYDGTQFLIDSYTVSYAPSAGVYAACHWQEGANSERALVLGVPDSQAPLIEPEVEMVHESLSGSELYIGAEANHALLFQKAGHAGVIHIATHGSFRPDNPMFSGIRLSDGYLYLYELYQLRLSADLVTFSGCGTGLSTIAEGDELLGLVRGALYAGARSLLLSLWDVHDRSTTEFMARFYKAFGAGQSKAQAFAEASRAVRQDHPHPYYWAPFVLVGKALNGNKAVNQKI
jgi:CHAT domain-containing protein